MKRQAQSKKIDCPVHKQPIEVVTLPNGTKKAICTCDVPNNKYKGVVVWEHIPTKEN